MVCEFLDIARAHFHVPIERLVFISIDGMAYKFGRTMCGLQDAEAALDCMSGSVATLGCKLGTFTNRVLTHGNLVGQRTTRCGRVCEGLANHFFVKSRDHLVTLSSS